MTSVVVPHAPASVAVVRHRLLDELAAHQVPEPVRDDAALVVSELVGNAVRHGRPLPGGGIAVGWEVCPDAVRLEVRDGGNGPTAAVPESGWTAESGRGLLLVQLLARHWETAGLAEGGTGVRAELPLSADAAARAGMSVCA